MPFTLTKTTQGLIAVVLLLPLLSRAGTVRVSFLDDKTVLRKTLEILRSSGCTQNAIVGFQRAVERYHANSFEFDSTKFPPCRDGFYSFESASRLAAALPRQQLCETPHAYELNCFDAVIGLAADRLWTRHQPDEIFGPILVVGDGRTSSFHESSRLCSVTRSTSQSAGSLPLTQGCCSLARKVALTSKSPVGEARLFGSILMSGPTC